MSVNNRHAQPRSTLKQMLRAREKEGVYIGSRNHLHSTVHNRKIVTKQTQVGGRRKTTSRHAYRDRLRLRLSRSFDLLLRLSLDLLLLLSWERLRRRRSRERERLLSRDLLRERCFRDFEGASSTALGSSLGAASTTSMSDSTKWGEGFGRGKRAHTQ